MGGGTRAAVGATRRMAGSHDGELRTEGVGGRAELVAGEQRFCAGGSGEIAEVELAAAGVEGGGASVGFVGEDGEARDGEDGDRGGLGQTFGGGEADADAGKRAGAICNNDGVYFGQGHVLGGEDFANGGDEAGGVCLAGEFGLGEEE